MDSLVGLVLLLLDIFITRLFVYTPQLCEWGSKWFMKHWILMEIYYPLLNYLHSCQPLIQIFLTLNRLSSVISPANHNTKWNKYRLPILFFILFSPFFIIWNTIISPKIIIFYFGGFFILGVKAVEWADMSLFLFVVRSFAVLVTVVSTVIMFLRMSKMKKRMISSERTLCFACLFHSICFMIPSFFEALAIFNKEYGNSWINFLIQPFAWDVLNVGSPFIMIFVSAQLRNHVFSWKTTSKRTQTVTVSLSSNAPHGLL
uniref:Serpentine receptor class gamma n=1 Tax=Caenorhabditis tropicalis TaxID=1561998 RepID=A0A1I7UMI9_9PELO